MPCRRRVPAGRGRARRPAKTPGQDTRPRHPAMTSPAFSKSADSSASMPDNIRFSSPDTLSKPPGYSHVVEVTGPGRTVYFAGQLGIDKSGKMGANAREQIQIAFENVKAALASVGARFEHVVKLNN